MSATGGLICWASICGTYLRFRKAVRFQELKDEVVKEAKSPLEPVLAWYGLLWSLFLCSPQNSCRANPKAVFQGYLMFARYNPYWAIVSTSWGFTVGPYALTGGFCMFVIAWLVRTRVRQGFWTLQVKPLDKVDLSKGVAPKIVTQEGSDLNPWRNIFHRILEAL